MPQREVHLRDYLEILRKYDFIICFSFLLIVGAALVVSLRLPKTYAASTLVLFLQPSSSPPVSSTSLFQSVLSGGVDRGEMETIGQRFSTASMLTSAIEKLEDAGIDGIRHLPSLSSLQSRLKAEVRADTRYIELSLRLHEDEGGERNAALLTNQLISDMQKLRSREERAKADHRRNFLNTKLSEILHRLKTQEDIALQFAREHGSPATWYPELASLLEQRVKLLDEQMQLERNLQGAQLELQYLHDAIETYPEYVKLSETISHDPIWLAQMGKLVELESQRVGLEQQLGEDAPEIKALDAQIADLQVKLKALVSEQVVTSMTEGPSPLFTNIQDRFIRSQTTLLQAENGLTHIEKQLKQSDRDLKQLAAEIPENDLHLEKLRREIDALHELIKEINKQSLEAEILLAESDYWNSESIQRRIQGGIEVVDSAVPRKIPVSPRIKFVAIVAGVIGCTVGVSIALLTEYFSNTYRHPEDVQSELGWLHLGTVMKRKEQDRLSSATSEDYRAIAASIELSTPETRKQILTLTSCDFSKDVSIVTANLGMTMAAVKERVLIVDCNVHQPAQHQFLGISLNSSEASRAAGDEIDWDDAIQGTNIPSLDLLSPGLLYSNRSDFLNLLHLQTLFQQLREQYELILIDAPPILPTADGLILSAHCDAIVLVVDFDDTPRETLRMCRDRLVNAQIPVLGFIET